MNRILIGGTGSGCGKTTVVCGILKALSNRGLKALSFKVGPDYIDPMFHKEITGVESKNLDAFLMGDLGVKEVLFENREFFDIAVIEGVMGFYDGVSGSGVYASSAYVGNITKTPAVLVLNAKGMSISLAAVVKGFLEFSQNTLKAVIINGVSLPMISYYKKIIEENCYIKVLGGIPFESENSIGSRNLGLITAAEVKNLHKKIDRLGELAEKYIDIDGLIDIARNTKNVNFEKKVYNKICDSVVIAVARDEAFCFYYDNNLKLLERLGARIVYFSPLYDEKLPETVNGIYIGGGYPELYLEKLEKNKNMIEDIKRAAGENIPLFAECGGFMYMHEYIESTDGVMHKMVGIIKGKVCLSDKLSDFGYVSLIALNDNIMCRMGESINAHEFHYSVSDNAGESFSAVKHVTGKSRKCIHAYNNIFCGYPHIHFYGNLSFAVNFLKACERSKRCED